MKINGDTYTAYGFHKVDWIIIEIPNSPASKQLVYTEQNYIDLENLKWPSYVNVNTPIIYRVLVENTSKFITEKIYNFANLSSSIANDFTKFELSRVGRSRGEANASFSFVFQASDSIPLCGMLIIDFAVEYNLLSSSPAVQVTYPEFSACTTNCCQTSTLNHYYSSAKLTIENLPSYTASTDFTVNVSGFKNPDTPNVFSAWNVSTNQNSKEINVQNGFAAFSLDPLFIPGIVTINRIEAMPDNANTYADYTFSFTPRSALGIGAQLYIKFPSQYKLLPSSPDCEIWGALTTFAAIETELSAIILTLDSALSSGGTISVKVKNIMNPVSGDTDIFIMKTRYDSTWIDKSDELKSTGKTLTIKAQAQPIYIQKFSFDPQNEGEVADYLFNFVPLNSLTKGQEIVIRFPDTFDITLGKQIICSISKGLTGYVTCLLNGRKVIIRNFDSVTPTYENPVEIIIKGVINPNRAVNADAGTITLGIRKENEVTFEDYTSEAGIVQPVAAAGWTDFQSLTATNYYSRYQSDYLFTFRSYSTIPSTTSNGFIIFEFPTNFLLNDGSLTCETTTGSYGTPACTVYSNGVRINGTPTDFSGVVTFNLLNVINPMLDGTSEYFIVKTYDGYKQAILERSFKNLDPYYFTYQYPGPIIIINDDNDITVEAGTQTPDLLVKIPTYSNMNITLKPSTPSGMSFVPFSIDVKVSDQNISFRVSVVESFLEGEYNIPWEIIGELIPPYNTPIKTTKIIVTKAKNVGISIGA